MPSQLTNVTSVVTTLLATLTSVVSVIVANPIMLIPIAGGLVGVGIGIFKKMK